MTTTYTYNTVNALTGERITNNTGTLVREYVYTVGSAGERLNVQETGNRTVTYAYDALYRLTGETVTENGVTKTTTYAWDSVSNRTSKTVGGVTTNCTYNSLNQLTSETGITYQYDLNGNRTGKAEGARTTSYTYDAFNRLIRATVQEAANVAVEEYGYDWKGNRIRKTRETDTTRYLVDTNNRISHVVAETSGTGALKAFSTRGGDTLIHMTRAGVKFWYLFDGHGSVRMLANAANAITDTWNFDAWGEITGRTGVTENDYLYAGERFDNTTKLYQLRARYMDPSTGTFMTMDTYQGNMHDPISLHKYLYANANPITNTDPTGMWSLGEMAGALNARSILEGAGGLNYWLILNMLQKAGYAVQFAYSMRDLVTSFLTENPEGMVLALANGAVSMMGMMGICQSGLAMQILTKALAAYGVKENVDAFLKAMDKGDVGEMIISGLNVTMDIIAIFSACFDGDTLVATENGFKRIDAIQVGDRVWSYNVETGEKSLKEVKQVLVKESVEILCVETTEGAIDATTNHPFYVTDKGWVAAGDLVVGDKIHTLSDDAGTITGLKLDKTEKSIPVYNLEVADFHSYFVGAGLLVHNKCEGTPGGNQRQNEQAKAIARKLGITDPDKIRAIHDLISRENLPFGKVLEEVRGWFEL